MSAFFCDRPSEALSWPMSLDEPTYTCAVAVLA